MSAFLFECPQKVEGNLPQTSLSDKEYKYNPVFPLKDNGYFYHFCPRPSEQLVQSIVTQGQEGTFRSTLVGFYCAKVGLGNCFEILAVEVLKKTQELAMV